MKQQKKRTYFTKSDLIEFGKYIESDERRLILAEKLIRQVTEEDFKDWLEFKQKKENAEKN